jgi:hypothetical protein
MYLRWSGPGLTKRNLSGFVIGNVDYTALNDLSNERNARIRVDKQNIYISAENTEMSYCCLYLKSVWYNVAQRQVNETWQTAWYFPVEPLCSLNGLHALKLVLSLPCFIHIVMPSPFLFCLFLCHCFGFFGALAW